MESHLISHGSSTGEKSAILVSHKLAHGHPNNNANTSNGNYPFWLECLTNISRFWSHVLIWLQQSQVKNLSAPAGSRLSAPITLLRLLTCGPACITIQTSALWFDTNKPAELKWNKQATNIRSSLGWTLATQLGPEVITWAVTPADLEVLNLSWSRTVLYGEQRSSPLYILGFRDLQASSLIKLSLQTLSLRFYQVILKIFLWLSAVLAVISLVLLLPLFSELAPSLVTCPTCPSSSGTLLPHSSDPCSCCVFWVIVPSFFCLLSKGA